MVWIVLLVLSLLFLVFMIGKHLKTGSLYMRPHLSISKGTSVKHFQIEVKAKKETREQPLDQMRLRVFNPFGKETQLEMGARFPESRGDFIHDLDLGPAFMKLRNLGNDGRKATVQLELYSSATGRSYSYMFPYKKFMKRIK